jgi:L-asparaginase II
MSKCPVPLVYIYRNNNVEAIHYGSVAVVDENGKLTHCAGDLEMMTMMRSSIKPFQALPLVISGGFDHFNYNEKQLALMCASHDGTDEHREVAASILKAAGNSAADLQCGSHWPIWMRNENIWPKNNEDKDPLRHNCSGKHSGFLALAKFLGDDTKKYLDPNGKTQRQIKQSVADMCEYPIDKIGVGVDGCSAPNFAYPLKNLAVGFKNLALIRAKTSELESAVNRVNSAMTAHPKMVSGEKRFDHDLMRSFPGKVVCKVGAEAVEGMGFSESKVGVVVKIDDGNARALYPVCVEVLKQLQIVDKIDNFPFLRKYEQPEIKNYRGITTGHIGAKFELKKV